MRIYIAARYSRLNEVQALAQKLRDYGYTVDASWIKGAHEWDSEAMAVENASKDVPVIGQRFAEDDIADIERSDVMICLTEEPRSTNGRGGRHVEYGYALAKGIPILILGPRENVFYCLQNRGVMKAPGIIPELIDMLDYIRSRIEVAS